MNVEKMTPYPELDDVLRDHAGRLQSTLGDFLVGVYLVGSLAIGDFDLTSDIDFIVVTRDELSEPQRKQVQSVHDQTYGQGSRWVKHFEYSFSPVKILNVPSSPFSQDGRTEGE
ncbi:MAG: nucleotidyltransferase domain-containing protein [Actinomycetota bacterium]